MNHPKEFAEGLSIGIIMDGNGRWAKQRGLPRTVPPCFRISPTTARSWAFRP